MAVHQVAATPRTVRWGVFDAAIPPVVTIQSGDTVVLDLPMTVRRVGAHPNLVDNRGRVAVERGPVVYCIEEVDNPGGDLQEVGLRDDTLLQPEFVADELGGYVRLASVQADEPVTLIPYHLWGHREFGQMAVWLRRG